MTARLFDTHAHLQLREFDNDRATVLERARGAGASGMLVLGVDAETSARALALATEHDDVFAAAGYHPHDAKDLTDQRWEEITRLVRDPRVVAVGEIGLDFYRDLSPRDVQISAFERQLDLARALSKPVAVHCRDAHETLLSIVTSWSRAMGGALPDGRPLGVMHYFSGDVALAGQCVDLGFLVSMHTSITYPNSQRLQEVAAALPLEALVTETDSPYGAPQSKRGQRNEPANVREAVEAIATLRGQSFDVVAESTTANAQRLLAAVRHPVAADRGAA